MLGHVGHAVHGAEPHDVVHVDVVADEVFPAVVDVNHSHESFALLAEEVEETAVLAELVGVGRIVGRSVVVAEEQHQPAPDLPSQPVAPGDVCLFVE